MNKALIKKDLFSHFTSIHFYVLTLIFYFTTVFQFFIFNRFFVLGFGTSNLSNFFSVIPYAFCLVIPILIFQVSDQELENIFPFSSSKIIFAKFISNIITIFVMILPLIFVPFFVNIFGQVDFCLTVTAFIGIILYCFLAISVCLFFNELIKNKSAFFAVSIVILLVINNLHQVPLLINCNKFFTNVFNSLSFVWHFDSFNKGIIDTRDLFFFLLTSVAFLIISIFINETKKGKNFFDKSLKPYSILVILIFIFAFIDNSRIWAKFDFTKDKQFSISKYTKENLSFATSPVRITFYRSKELLARYPEVKNVNDYLQICAKENKNITLKVLDADKSENVNVLKKLNVAPQQIQIVNNNKTEYINIFSCIVIEYEGKQQILPFVLSTASLEFELNLRLESLIKNKTSTVYIMCGNEYEIDSYNYVTMLLESSNIKTFVITKESLLFFTDQLNANSTLLLFGTNMLSQEQASVIEKFILDGGKVFIATSNYSVDVNGSWDVYKNVNDNFIPVLKNWNINFEDKIVNDISNVRVSFYSPSVPEQNNNTQYEYINYPQWVMLLPQKEIPQGITMFWPSPILTEEKNTKLFYSSTMSWTVKEFNKTIQSETEKLFVTNPFLVEKNAIQDPLFTKEKSLLGVKLNTQITGLYNFKTCNEPNVIVIPDQYFVMDLLLELSSQESQDFRNIDFVLRSILKLNGDDELLKLQNNGFKNTSLYKVTNVDDFEKLKSYTLIIIFVVIPSTIILLGIIIQFIRKKQNERYIN